MAAVPTRVTVRTLIALLLVGGLARPMTGREAARRQAHGGAVPARIVSLVPATTEMLFAIGAGSQVVGVGSYDRYPPEVEKLPRMGGLLDPNVERVLALKPDLVVVYATQVDLKRQLEAAGISVFEYVHRGLAEISQTMRALGERTGHGSQASALVERIEGVLRAIRSRVAGRPRPRTLLVFGREPGSLRNIDASGGYGFLHDVLIAAGGDDALGDIRKESVQMSTEMVLARAPDVIVELRYGTSVDAAQEDAERRVWNALASVPAVKNGRVYMLVGEEFVVPGPRIAIAAERLSRLLHPQVW